jgi:hypothetical protein
LPIGVVAWCLAIAPERLRMPITRIFLGYMALIGIAAGAILVIAPRAGDFWLKPYFWVLIAAALFEGGAYLHGRNAPGTMLTMDVRLLGFLIGVVLMVMIPSIAGSPARFF